jgi:homoserine O-acetyltransferase
LISFDTDWLFPVTEVERVESAMLANGTPARHERISSPNGHDTFLIDYDLITPPVKKFLEG